MPGAIIKKMEFPFKNHINLMHIYLQVNNKLSAGDRRIGMKFHRFWQANRNRSSRVKFIKRGKRCVPRASPSHSVIISVNDIKTSRNSPA